MSASSSNGYLLHRLVWENKADVLRDNLQKAKHDLEAQDPYGRTALRLAVSLDRKECAKVLMDFGADATAKDASGWTAVHDATATGDMDLLKIILEDRNYRLHAATEDRIPQLLDLLKSSEDFSLEMRWEFSSWIPFLSRMAPSDTYRIWKKGSSVRVDTTLLGFENMKWIRGHRSFVFRCIEGAQPVQMEMTQIDHEGRVAFVERSGAGAGAGAAAGPGVGRVSRDELRTRMNNPVTCTVMDSDKIGFSRVKSGFWGWQSDKTEDVNGYPCEVYDATGIEVVTRTRLEHLPAGHAARAKGRTPFSQVLTSMTGGDEAAAQSMAGSMLEGVEETEVEEEGAGMAGDEDAPLLEGKTSGASVVSADRISFDEYLRFAPPTSDAGYGRAGSREGAPVVVVGRPQQVRTKVQKFKARLSMCRDFPLSLHTQVLPIIDLLAPTSQHISKLRDFISLQLPTGFPVKTEIPVYHVLTARVTFGSFQKGCAGGEDVFAVPEGYRVLDGAAEDMGDEDAMLALALQQSMHAQEMYDFGYGYGDAGGGGDRGSAEMLGLDDGMQRALMDSLVSAGLTAAPSVPAAVPGAILVPGLVGGGEQRTVAAGPWACEACTYENPATFLACEMCGSVRPTPPAAVTGGPSERALQRILNLSALEAQAARAQAGGADEDEELRLALERSMSDK